MSRAIATELVDFWRDAGMGKWFRGGDAFDAECRTRWLDAHFSAARREFDDWMDDAEGALALVLLLDQIPRNVFRNSGHAFATDPLALHVASRAIDAIAMFPASEAKAAMAEAAEFAVARRA